MKFERDTNCNNLYFSNVSKVTYDNDTNLQTFTYLGYTYLIFVFGKTDYFDHYGDAQNIPKIMLKGASDFFSVKGYKESGSIAFELPAQALHLASGIPASELKNINFDLAEVIGDSLVNELYHTVVGALSFEEMKDSLTASLKDYLPAWNKKTKTSDIVEHIHKQKGLISKQEIEDKFSISERSLERYFMKEVGLSPYSFIAQIRFNNILQDLQLPENNINQLIVDYNYFDRSHFEKDFEKFLGKRIVEYKNGKPSLFEAALERSYVN